jgi:dipeptidyl aminopeptidase/acylaminoacyl peptidase
MDEDGRPPSVGVVGSGTISGVEPGPWAATWSPTGDAFVFTGSTGDGDLDLWISDPRGRDVRRLTQGIGADFSPRFDPTGDLVLFLRNVEGRPMATFTVDVTTGHTERVPVPDVPMEVTWGAGGRSVIAVTHSGREGDPNRLVQVSLVGRAPTILYRGSFNEPSASPDGAWIAISAEGRLVLVPTDGSGDQVLVEGLDLDGLSQLSWSPDGAHLLFTDPVDPVAGERLRVVEVASGTSEVVADTLAWRGSAPAWSPDSRWIAFERAGDIWAVDIRTHQLSRMTETDGHEAYPSWGSG